MVSKRTIDEIDVHGRRVLVRLDLNVPLDDRQRITDDRRIRAALPTVRKLIDGGGRLILMSHLGRPTGDRAKDQRYSLRPVARRMGELLGQAVRFTEWGEEGTELRATNAGARRRHGGTNGETPDVHLSAEVRSTVDRLKDGECCLLENLRFVEAETIKDKNAAGDPGLRQRKDRFAAGLAELGDVYVNDAFGTCHRDNASMLTLPQRMAGRPRVIGYLVEKELKFLGAALADPKRPFVVVLGGAKVSDKVGAIEALLGKCDVILVGGAMAYTFMAADGLEVGKSLVEPDRFDLARRLRAKAGDKLRLPLDSVAADSIASDAATTVCEGSIPGGMMGLDIGPKTIANYREVLLTAGTIVWNGPMGVFETPPFDAGTVAIANATADATERGAVTIVGGGDSAAAVEAAGVADRVSHLSTGGGASLEFLEGKSFAAIDILDDASLGE